MRGQVLPLMGSDRLNRMRYLGGLLTIDRLDGLVRKAGAPKECPDIYYLLTKHNGGKDPTASDPASRWKKLFRSFVNVTCDCIGGMAWCGGWDRYQPVRFSHIYGGWINTDSMIMDATGPAKCFKVIHRPEPGCYVVFNSQNSLHGKGHIGGIIEIPEEYEPHNRSWWKKLTVVDVAHRTPHPANAVTTGLTWYNHNSLFIVPIMRP